jgi:SEC-C motif
VSVGRNESCPCGSGAKYKRCCLERELELGRLVPELEATVQDLGRETWAREPGWCAERFAEFYGAGPVAFGLVGPSEEELLDARLWFLLDCPLPEGRTPLWARRESVAGRAVELLARSELRAWRIESVGESGLLTGLCPRGTGRARLETIRPPLGDLRPGAMVVARSVPLGPERWALLGRIPVVELSVAADFDWLLASLDAPPGEFWRVHGGVLSHAAWVWPEVRDSTADGEVLRDAHVNFDVVDLPGAEAALDADPELERVEVWSYENSITWHWRWDPPAARRRPPEPGVRLELCKEEAAETPYLATVTLSRDHADLFCLAPTPARLGLAQRLLAERLGGLLGAADSVRIALPEVTPRWTRLRLADVPLAAALASLRPSQAA